MHVGDRTRCPLTPTLDRSPTLGVRCPSGPTRISEHVIPHIGQVQLHALTSDHLDGLYADLLKPGASKRGKVKTDLSPTTIRTTHTVIKRALKDACKRDLLARNPAENATPPSAAEPEPKAWTGAELKLFLDRAAADEDRDFPLWLLIASTGMRRGEALGLRYADIDLEAGVVKIRRALVTVNHDVMVMKPKTRAGARTVELDDRTVTVLRSFYATRAAERLLCGHGKPAKDDYVFTSPAGEQRHPSAVSRRFARKVSLLRRELGTDALPAIGLHGLRHTFATLALEAGVSARYVQKILGHASVAITLGTYSHVTETGERQAVERVTSVFA